MIPQLWYYPSHAKGLELDKLVRMHNSETWLLLDRVLNLDMKAKLYNAKELYQYKYIPVFLEPLSALKQGNFVVNPVSNSAISLCTSSTELTYPKLSACLPSSKGSRFKIPPVLFVPQESWDLQLRMFGYITGGFPIIFGCVLQVIKYSISVPLDRGGWNLMLTVDRSCVMLFLFSTVLLNTTFLKMGFIEKTRTAWVLWVKRKSLAPWS